MLTTDGGDAELLAADCDKAWLHAGWEDTRQKWFDWLVEMKKKDEWRKKDELHQQRVSQVIKSAEGSAGVLHEITKPAVRRGGAQTLGGRRRRACQAAGPM